ncbi:MAG: MarR family transcriptional regulator [Cyclobacteriaceae bacterium]|nr:MarR family transcriptional regulator [Cyclobacteriaceae bacterium]
MKVKANNITRLATAFERLMVKMEEVDDFCVELTKDISKQDLSLIGYIGRQEEVIMREVATYCEVPLSTATWCVDKLVEKKYLKRVNSQEDRRIVKVSLTKKGQGVFELFQSKKYEMGERMLGNLSKERQEAFIETLEYIARNLQAPVAAASFKTVQS